MSANRRLSSLEMLVDYEQRSLAHVAGRPETVEAPGHWRGVGYRIGSHRLVSSFEEIIEILPLPALTPVPGAQSWMLGVTNVRGSLLPVVDLRLFLEGQRSIVHDNHRMLVVRQGGGHVAVLIDQLFGQRIFNDTHRTDATDSDGRFGHFIARAFRLGEEVWNVFDMHLLTRTPEFRQAAA
jgi:twitching motility protein PilI